MLTYIFIGLAFGSIYAIASASLVITYESAGILNFAFGSMAFFVARFYYWANSEQGWSIGLSAVVTLLVVAPALGVVLYLGVFQFLRDRSTLIKIVATIGLSVAIPAVAVLIFGNTTIQQAPGLAPTPVKFWHVFGATLDLNQVIIYGFLIAVVGIGTSILRFTDVGLKVRAMVDSEALTSLSGTNPNRVALGVWASSGLLAGIAGVLVAPTQGVSVDSLTLLMATSFAAVVAARLRNLGAAVGISLLMGLVTDVSQYWLPANSQWSSNIVQAVPFVFILVFLVYYLIRGGSIGQESKAGGALDKAIRPEGGDHATAVVATTTSKGKPLQWYSLQSLAPLVPLLIIAIVPALTSGYWLGLVARGLALGVVLLSFSLVTGEGGMTWLCQITFAGGGALLAAELSSSYGVDPFLCMIIAGVAMAPVGVLIGALTIRLGDLYVALVTLSFGLLVDKVVFSDTRFSPGVGGVTMSRPAFAADDRQLSYFIIAVLFVLGLLIVNLRRSTTGLAISAVRWSEPASRTLGLSVVRLKILLSGFAAFTAGIGGALLAMYDQSADPSTYATFGGLVWLAVLVTIGLRSITAAVIAGLVFMVVPGIFATYVPLTWAQVPAVLFGLGAIGLARNPDGVVAMHARQLQHLLFNRGGGSGLIAPALTPAAAGIDLTEGGPSTAAAASTAADVPAGVAATSVQPAQPVKQGAKR